MRDKKKERMRARMRVKERKKYAVFDFFVGYCYHLINVITSN
jgi:hypothetical protein